MIEAKADRNDDKNALSLFYFLLNFVQEDVAVVTHDHTEAWNWSDCLVYLVQHVADCLRPIPIAWFSAISQPNTSDAVNSKRA